MSDLSERFAESLAEHDWRWATRDRRTGDGVRIACIGCGWFAERQRGVDPDVFDQHTAHVAEVLAATVADHLAAAEARAARLAEVVAGVEALADEWDSTVYKLPAGYPMTVAEFCRLHFKAPLRAALASPASVPVGSVTGSVSAEGGEVAPESTPGAAGPGERLS